MKTSKFILLALLLGNAITLHAQAFDKSKMDSLFSIIEKNNKGMGSISIFQNGKEVYQKSYGYANLEKKIKANATTKYRIGSISKTFTATVIMKLIENGKLSLSTTLKKFYPQIQNADKITIEQLLQHRSGIANFTNVEDYLSWNTEKQTKEQLLSRIIASGISFEPGEKFEYSNSNYVLLTFIAEDASHKKFPDLLQEYIIIPCHLKNTYIGGKTDSNRNEALSYSRFSEWIPEKETDLSIPLGAGCIVSTPTDLNIFFDHLFRGKLIEAKSLTQMTTLKDKFGYGLIQVPFNEMKGYGHTGGIDGFQSNAFYFPEQKISISVISNGVVFPLNDIIVGGLSIFFGKDYSLPKFKDAIITLKTEELDKYLGTYSSPLLPIKITISRNGCCLVAQGTGQPSFPLECFEKDKFKFDQAHVKMEFTPDENKMILKQNGMIFEMTKE